MGKKKIRKRLFALLLSALLVLALSACSVPMKEETEPSPRTEAAEQTGETEKTPEKAAFPRLKFIGNGNSMTELFYDADGKVIRRNTYRIAEYEGQNLIETEILCFDAEGSITDYRLEGVPKGSEPEETVCFEGNRLIVSRADSVTTREFEKGRQVGLHIQSASVNYLVEDEFDGGEWPVRQVVQLYEVQTDGSEPKKIYQSTQIMTLRYEYDAAGLPLYSYLTDTDGWNRMNQYTVYLFENRPETERNDRLLKAVLGGHSVYFLTYYTDGTAKKNEKRSLAKRYDESGKESWYEQTEIIGFETNGDILSRRVEKDPSAEEETFTISGRLLETPFFSQLYHRGRVIQSHFSYSWDNDRLIHREAVYEMDQKGLYQTCHISWYLTSVREPSGEKESVPEYPDSEQKYVYFYDDTGLPIWSYQLDEEGEPLTDSIELYLFE